jgi:LRR receptor-like serine/threonine-protein kinase FLS2
VNDRHDFFTLPFNLGNIAGLQELYIQADFVGELPISMSNLTQLQRLSIGTDTRGFSFFPSWLTNMTSLQYASFSNFISVRGGFPDLAGFPSLQELEFHQVGMDRLPNVAGSISIRALRYSNLPYILSLPEFGPACIPTLTELRLIGLTLLRVPLPLQLFNCSNLTSLVVIDVPFSGEIPPLIENLATLEVLHLQQLNLAGPVPAELATIRTLKSLTMRDLFNISGELPAHTLGWPNLTQLTLANTQITSISSNFSSSLNLMNVYVPTIRQFLWPPHL